MKKHLFSVLLAVITLIFTIALLFVQLQFRHQKQEIEQEFLQKDFLFSNLKDDLQNILKNEGCKIDTSIVLVNLKNDTISMGRLNLKKAKYLCLFFSAEYCSDCVNYCLTQMKTLLSDNKNTEMLFFASKYQLRDLYVFARSNQFPNTAFFCTESLKIPIEQSKEPFMFVLDEQLSVSHFFIPRKEMPELTQRYLKIVKLFQSTQ